MLISRKRLAGRSTLDGRAAEALQSRQVKQPTSPSVWGIYFKQGWKVVKAGSNLV